MHYEGNVIRPPSEADSLILQVTLGCSHNRCRFCVTYQGQTFRLKDQKIIDEDLAFAKQYCQRQRRVFLADGDVLSLPQASLVDLLQQIRNRLPWVNRIALYGNAKNIIRKSVADLITLKELGLALVYMGVESGDDQTLASICKGADSNILLRAGQQVREAGIFLSTTVLLGIAGAARSLTHAMATGKMISTMQPNQVGVLTLMLLPGTPLYDDAIEGKFSLPDQDQLLLELATMVRNIDLPRVQFQSNHASNYLPINCRLPRDRNQVLAAIELARTGKIALKPEHLRAL